MEGFKSGGCISRVMHQRKSGIYISFWYEWINEDYFHFFHYNIFIAMHYWYYLLVLLVVLGGNDAVSICKEKPPPPISMHSEEHLIPLGHQSANYRINQLSQENNRSVCVITLP